MKEVDLNELNNNYNQAFFALIKGCHQSIEDSLRNREGNKIVFDDNFLITEGGNVIGAMTQIAIENGQVYYELDSTMDDKHILEELELSQLRKVALIIKYGK